MDDEPRPISATADQPTTLSATSPSAGSRNAEATRQAAARESGGAQAGDVLLGRFRLERLIGEGGMGRVYAARDLQMDGEPQIAIKILSEALQTNPMADIALQRECRKVRMLANDAIVRVFEFYRADRQAFITMELLEGESLDALIRRCPQGMSLEQALPMIRAAGKALAYAHEQQPPFVHSDFKPSNVFVTRAGKIKVLDFGVARAVRSSEVTTSGLSLFDPAKFGALTPAYASCEMLAGLPADPRDDVYALACVAYELLSGRHPYERRPADQARGMKLKLKPIAAVSGDINAVLARGMALEREARTGSADQFVAELCVPESITANPIASPLKAALAIVPAVLAAGVVFWFWHRAGTTAKTVSQPPRVVAETVAASTPSRPVTEAPAATTLTTERARPAPPHPKPVSSAASVPVTAKPAAKKSAAPQVAAAAAAAPAPEPLTSPAPSLPSTDQGYPIDRAQIGATYQRSFQAYGYDVPLPPGEWVLLSGAQIIPNLRFGNTGHDYVLARIERQRVVEGMRIQALRSAPAPDLGFAKNPFCEDPNNLYAQIEALSADAHQSCWRVYDLFTGGWLDLASDQDAVHAAGVRRLLETGVSFPQDLLTVAFFRAETWGALLVSYSFSPEHQGIASHTANSARESDWYIGNLNRYPEKADYVAKLRDWGNASWPKFKQAFDQAGPR
jgi:serine/threonine protein kinase